MGVQEDFTRINVDSMGYRTRVERLLTISPGPGCLIHRGVVTRYTTIASADVIRHTLRQRAIVTIIRSAAGTSTLSG